MRKLLVENFLSFRSRQTLDLRSRGILLVEGKNLDESDTTSNRAGKSALVEAIVWCLYGKTIRGLRHDQVVNRFVKRNCRVSLWLRKREDRYRVDRYRRHEQYGNQLCVFRNGQELRYRHEVENQKLLEELLEMDFACFTSTVILGGARPFSLLTDAEQKKLLESFLGFEQIDAAQRRVRDWLAGASQEESEALEQLARHREVLAASQARLTTLKAAHQQVARQSDATLEKAKLRRTDLEHRLHLWSRPERRCAELGDLLETLAGQRAKVQGQLVALEEQLGTTRGMLGKVREALGQPCPFCRTPISQRTLKVVRQSAKQELIMLLGRHGELCRERQRLAERIEVSRQELEGTKPLAKRAAVCRGELQALGHTLVELCEQRQAGEEMLRQIEAAFYGYSQAVAQILACEQQMCRIRLHKEELTFWEEGFGTAGIKALISRAALPALNLNLQNVAGKLLGEHCRLEFVPVKTLQSGEERELFHVAYNSKYGANSYLAESAGGRRRVDICVLLCFCALFRRMDLLLVDELLDGLDERGQELTLGVLAETYGTVLLISHRQNLSLAGVAGRVLVTKQKGTSVICETSC